MDGGEGGGEALGVRSEQLEQGGLIELVVAKAQDVNGALLQGLGAPGVVLGVIGVVMRGSVQLEGQAARGAVEVDDEAGDELLAPELEAEDRAVAEDLPSGRLGGGRRLAKAPGESELVGVDVRVPDDARWSCRVGHGRSSTRGRHGLRGGVRISLRGLPSLWRKTRR